MIVKSNQPLNFPLKFQWFMVIDDIIQWFMVMIMMIDNPIPNVYVIQ